jgi:hypothetical protein
VFGSVGGDTGWNYCLESFAKQVAA